MMNEWIENLAIQNKGRLALPVWVFTAAFTLGFSSLIPLKLLDRRTAVFQRSAGIAAGSLKRCARTAWSGREGRG
jgi:hypothetical protein